MADAIQPVAGSLAAIVVRACQVSECPHFQSRECPEHSETQDLGVVSSFDYRTEVPPRR